MPLATVQSYLKGVLDQTLLPLDLGVLSAYIQPPNPGDGTEPAIYIWGARGDESRRTVPRAEPRDLSTGGHKVIQHDVSVWVVWIGPSVDEMQDVQFPAIIDTVTAVLRNLPLLDQAQNAVDPVTGQESNLLNVGEQMTWEYAPVRAVADQRYLRYDALITVSIEEWFQA